MIVVAVLGLVVAMSTPILSDARMRGNESAALSQLRTITTAQIFFHHNDADRNGTTDYATSLTALHAHGELIDEALADGIQSGYRFEILEGVTAFTWSAVAEPHAPGRSGEKFFYIDETGVPRFSTTGRAGPADSPIGN
jgi:hypothetical protein